ncbi:MAG: L-threonylcarbamoyladenylate synthase [Acidimicrobiia bacterium]
MTAHPDVERAAMTLRRGGLVAFPTETVYGLGADATNDDALRRLFVVKGRPASHPLIVHLGATAALDEWAGSVPDVARALAARFWPGPLTLVLAAGPAVSRVATGGLDTVGLRVPAHPLALALLDAFGGAIAAPSANRFGRVSPTTADAVRRDLGNDVDLVLDGGPCAVGVESTIVDCTTDEVRVLRLGGVTLEMLAAVLGAPPAVGGTTPAPGTLPAHYAPDAHVMVVDARDVAARAQSVIELGHTVGVIGLADAVAATHASDRIVNLATLESSEEYARRLYSALREADELGVDVVLAVPPPPAGLGAAVADRLRRAAAAR